jgi:hypothetical protein
VKTIQIQKEATEGWMFEFSDDLTIRDINILGRRLKQSFLQTKRRKSMRAKSVQRAAAKLPVKEAANAAA